MILIVKEEDSGLQNLLLLLYIQLSNSSCFKSFRYLKGVIPIMLRKSFEKCWESFKPICIAIVVRFLVDDPAVILSSWRKAAGQEAYVIRLFESTGRRRKVKVCLPLDGYEQELELKPFELITFQWTPPITEISAPRSAAE